MMRGDKITITRRDGKMYHGVVHVVEETRVLMQFHPSFHVEHVDDIPYPLAQFTVKDIQCRRRQRVGESGGKFLSAHFLVHTCTCDKKANDAVCRQIDVYIIDHPYVSINRFIAPVRR